MINSNLNLKNISISFIFFVIFFAFMDFFVSKFFLKFELPPVGKINETYHHTLKENLDNDTMFGSLKYRLCTNNFGLKISCKNLQKNQKEFKYAFIGDSFTEGVGFSYEKTFVGIFDKESKKSINLAVSSYSNAIYYSKIYDLIERKNFKFEEVILFFDNTDIIQDENYVLDENIKVIEKSIEEKKHINDPQQRTFLRQLIHDNFKVTKSIYINFIRNIFFKDSLRALNDEYIKFTFSNKTDFLQNDIDISIDNSFSFLYELSNYLKLKNIKFNIAIYPHPTQLKYDRRNSKMVKKIKEFCLENCDSLINYYDFFFDEVDQIGYMKTYEKYWILSDIHLNEFGHKFIANKLISKFN